MSNITTDQQAEKTPLEIADEVRKAWECDDVHMVHERDLVALTYMLAKHPDWWDGPCICADCREYADE